jgi:beta-1,4-N-acetylglucosaminyltransferase
VPVNAPKVIDVEYFGLKPNSDEYIAASDILIGHCGAGTVLDALKSGTLAIAVSNEQMMNNHQRELLDELKECKHILGLEHSSLVNPERVNQNSPCI